MARMIDGDALLEKMKHRREYIGRPSDPVCLVEDAPTVGGWISINDRLPEDEYECLVITKDCWYYIGWFKGDIQKWVVNGVVWCDETITHWIKIPEPPKEDD